DAGPRRAAGRAGLGAAGAARLGAAQCGLFPAAALAWLVRRAGALAQGPLGRRTSRNPLDAAAAAVAHRAAVAAGRPAGRHRGEPAGLEPTDRRAGVRLVSAWLWLLVPATPLLA